jgi:exosortase
MNETRDNESRQNWWQDTVDCWQRLPNKIFFFVLLAAWLALFQFLGNSILGYIHTPSLFSWMHEAYRISNSGGDDAQGNFIPFLVVGLFWWKRKELLALPLKLWWPGLFLLVFALALHILGYVVQQPRLSIVALFAGIYGLMGLAWGRAWLRESFFPFFLFIFSVPLGEQGNFITFPLRLLVSRLVEIVAHGLGIGVMRVGTQLYDPSGAFQYEVAAACSGIRSLVAIFLLATIYGFFTFPSAWKRIFFMALAFPLAVLGNLLRMLFIIVAAEMGGQKWGDFIHGNWFFSIVPYIPVIIGLLVIGRWMEKHEARKQKEPS